MISLQRNFLTDSETDLASTCLHRFASYTATVLQSTAVGRVLSKLGEIAAWKLGGVWKGWELGCRHLLSYRMTYPLRTKPQSRSMWHDVACLPCLKSGVQRGPIRDLKTFLWLNFRLPVPFPFSSSRSLRDICNIRRGWCLRHWKKQFASNMLTP